MIKRGIPALLNYVLGFFRETVVLFALEVPVLMGEAYEKIRYLSPSRWRAALSLLFLYFLSKFKDKHA
ncbi:hypothetical protein GGD67_002872 [Bradyrhizobium sp. IAR9]|uniref:hypothetical protein n=1 Tax=Bradyrhizobium sp. IAR9 TaxID=2663841 RepID=UPI0015C6E043|nr:hypothetical protein [Bradyrhizobium sp. IAR9]NYG45414.1 hypothetical protein [Bradyrhizobium sp. IAR9]